MMKEKIELGELFKAHLGENFAVAQSLLEIRMNAESIERFAHKKVEEDGEFAKVYAETISDWLAELAKSAEVALKKVVEVNKGKGLN